jgi:hypothetical protein
MAPKDFMAWEKFSDCQCRGCSSHSFGGGLAEIAQKGLKLSSKVNHRLFGVLDSKFNFDISNFLLLTECLTGHATVTVPVNPC